MDKFDMNFETAASECAQKYSVDYDSLKECANSKLGNRLLFEAGEKTHGLRPKLDYVPWITADDMHTNNIQFTAERNLSQFICSRLKELFKIECDLG